MYWGRHMVKMLKAVDCLARPGGASMDELAAELEVDRRTAYRIRDTLEELNFPLYEDTSNLDGRKRYCFEDSYLRKLPNLNIPELNFSLSELLALYFIRSNSRQFHGTDIERDIESAFMKLDAFMPEGLAGRLEKVKTLFVPTAKHAKDYSDKQDVIESLTEAIFRQQNCLIEYRSFHDHTIRNLSVDPLSFFEKDGGLYIFARATKNGQIRVLAVERIENLTVEDSTFELPKDFDPNFYLDGAFGIIYDDPTDYTIRFSADVARLVSERSWGRDQKITEYPDGSLLLELRTSGWMEIKKWILSFGQDAEILEPEMMREQIAESLKAASAIYFSG